MEQLYINIKNRRIELGLTQTELAEKMGYADKSMIAKIEAGGVDLARSKIIAFAEVLQINPGDLLGWEEDADNEGHYLNPETAQIAEELYANPEMRILFDTTRKATPDDLKKIQAMVEIMLVKENGEGDY